MNPRDLGKPGRRTKPPARRNLGKAPGEVHGGAGFCPVALRRTPRDSEEMTTSHSAGLDRAIGTLPRTYPGPGGAIAVLRDGAVLARHAWGWANAERRIAFTPGSL